MQSTQSVIELPIPSGRVEKALLTGAFPGFYGNVELFLSITPRAAEGVIVCAIRNHSIRAHKLELVTTATEAVTDREAKVRDWMDTISPALVLRTRIVKIVGHFKDGMLSECQVTENES
jgi:hypothetical protein